MRKFDTHLESVDLKNFLSFYEGHVEFDSGLTVIVGPNGSGKTSIFHAIKFALGSNQRENRYSKWSDFIRHGSSSAEVEVVARVNGQTRRFQRKITRDGIPRSYIDGKRVKAAELQSLVSDLGFDIDNPLVFMPQERINAIRDMDPIEVRKLVEEGTGLSILRDRIYLEETKVHHSRERLITATSEAQVVERELELLQGDIERLQRKRELLKQEKVLDIEVKWATLDELTMNIEKIRSDIEEKERGLSKVLDEIVALEDQVEKGEHKVGELEKDASSLQREMGGISARIDEEERRLSKIEGDTKQVLDEIRELEKRINAEKRRTDKMHEDLKRIGSAKEHVLEKQRQIRIEIDQIEDEREKVENELAAFAEWNAKRSSVLGTYRALQADIRGKDLLFRSLQEKLQNDEAEFQAIESKWGHIWTTLEGTDEKELARKKGQVEREIASLNERRFQSATRASQLQKEIDDIRLRLTESAKRIPDSVMELTTAISEHNLESVIGPIVEVLNTKDEFASTLEAIFPGNLAFSFIVEDEAEFALLHRLRDRINAPSPIILIRNTKSLKKEKSLPSWKGVVGYLWDLIGLDPEMVSKMRAAFGDYVVTKDTQTSTRSAQRENLHSISMDGQLIEPSEFRIVSHPKREPSGVIATAPLQARLASAESELVIERNQMTDIIGRIEEVAREREEVMDLMSQLTRWSGTWERRKKLREIIPSQEERIVALDDEIKKLQLDFGKAEKSLKKLDNTQPPERSRLVGQQSALRMKYRKLREELNQIDSRLQTTQNDELSQRQELRSLEENTKMLSVRVVELREEISSSKSKGSKIVELIESLRTGLENTRSQYDELVAQQGEARGEIRQLSERLLELNLTVKDSKIQVIQSKRHLENFQHQRDSIRGEFRKKKRPEKVREIDVVRDDLLRVRHQLEEYRDVSETVAHTETKLKDQLAELTEKVEIIEKELSEAEETVKDIRKQYHDGMNEVLGNVETEINNILQTVRFAGDIKFNLNVTNQVYGVEFRTRIKTEEFGDLSAGSGGERSLIAIGLILALQRFNPAPVYAMDEIDTFLDATNTELVSRLLHDSSRRSQFILFTPAKSTHLLKNADRRLGVVSPSGKDPSVIIESPRFVDQ